MINASSFIRRLLQAKVYARSQWDAIGIRTTYQDTQTWPVDTWIALLRTNKLDTSSHSLNDKLWLAAIQNEEFWHEISKKEHVTDSLWARWGVEAAKVGNTTMLDVIPKDSLTQFMMRLSNRYTVDTSLIHPHTIQWLEHHDEMPPIADEKKSEIIAWWPDALDDHRVQMVQWNVMKTGLGEFPVSYLSDYLNTLITYVTSERMREALITTLYEVRNSAVLENGEKRSLPQCQTGHYKHLWDVLDAVYRKTQLELNNPPLSWVAAATNLAIPPELQTPEYYSIQRHIHKGSQRTVKSNEKTFNTNKGLDVMLELMAPETEKECIDQIPAIYAIYTASMRKDYTELTVNGLELDSNP